MRIVIDIDNDIYTRFSSNEAVDAMDMLRVWKAIRKGTPLPKGHGRLIDADALEVRTGTIDDWAVEKFVYLDEIEDAPTVIEADRAEGEG